MNLKQNIARNLIISFSGKILAGILGVVSIGLMTRTLGIEKFGVYSTVFAFLYVFSVFADFGLSSFLTKEISKPGVREKEIVSDIFLTRFSLLCIVFFTAFIIVPFTPYTQEARIGIFIATVGFFFLSLSGVLMGIFQKHLKTIIPTVADICARVVQVVLVYYLYLNNGNVIQVLFVFVSSSILYFSIIYTYAVRYTHMKLVFQLSRIYRVLQESWPLAVSSLLVLVYFKGDAIILSFLQPAHDVGIYNVAYKILENIIFFPIMFVGLVMPLLSQYFISNIEKFKNVFQKTFDFLMMIAIPLVCGGWYLAPGIVRLIAGDGFSDAVLPFKVLLGAMFLIFLGALFGHAIIAINKQKQVMYVYGVAAILNITANLYFIRNYSYIGAAWTTLFTELFVSFFMFILIYKTIGFIPRFQVVFKSSISSLGMLGVLLIFPVSNIFILVVSGVLVYGVLMLLLGGVTRNDINLFMSAAKNKN